MNLLLYLPRLVMAILLGEYTLITLALMAIFAGLSFGLWIGLFAFFAGYFLVRLVNGLGEAIVANAKLRNLNR